MFLFFLNIKQVCLIQIKCVDFNSTQFNTFGIKFNAIQHNLMCFQIASNSTIRRLFELRQIDVKKRQITLN